VIGSEDILPIILLDLKEQFAQDSLKTGAAADPTDPLTLPKWRGPFRTFLQVNRTFLNAGSNTMEYYGAFGACFQSSALVSKRIHRSWSTATLFSFD
jgi:hypothetical protein